MKKWVRSEILSLIVAGGCIMSAAAQAADKVNLQLPWVLNSQFAGYAMAKEQGFYEEAGIDLTISPGGPQVNATSFVASGAATIGSIDALVFILANLKGMDLVAVGACFQDNPASIISLTGSGITKPQDLVGKTIAHSPAGTSWILSKAMLQKAGVDLKTVKYVVSSANELLMNKNVDAKAGYALNEALSISLAGYPTSVMRAVDYGINAYTEVLFLKRQTIEQNPDMVRRFLAATVKGYEFAYENQDLTIKTLLRLNSQLDPKKEKEQLEMQREYIFTGEALTKGICTLNQKSFEETQNIMISTGDLEKPLDMSKFVDPSFLPQ